MIGVDEVGRGPLAGPVAVGVVALPRGEDFFLKEEKTRGGLRDSKKMTEKQREWWFDLLTKQPRVKIKISLVGPKIIDRVNISRATDWGARRAVKKILAELREGDEVIVVLDYGIKLKLEDKRIKGIVSLVRADSLVPAVSLAAVAAKVRRDRYMRNKDDLYPEFDFGQHVGYGTKEHIKRLKKVGPTKLHRQSFIKNFLT